MSQTGTSFKDHPGVWFEYKNGYDFLGEEDTIKKTTVNVQSFSTTTETAHTPAAKRRRLDEQYTALRQEATPAQPRPQQQKRRRRQRSNQNQHPE